MDSGLKNLVSPAEVLRVVQKILGSPCELLGFEVEKGTTSVQGLLSLILRVIAEVKIPAGRVSVKFIVKRFPELPMQKKMVTELGAFDREI